MERTHISILILLLMTSLNCKRDLIRDTSLPDSKNLSEFKKTLFIPTLEHNISYDTNSIYCATLLFAWDEIRKQIDAPLNIPDEHIDLKLINQSKTFLNVLKDNEYSVTGKVEGNLITASAEFYKSLPFEHKLDSYNNSLMFDGENVSSFGLTGYSKDKLLEIIKILYYKNDENFIIKLLPNDEEHEIILFKTSTKFNSIFEMITEIEKLSEIGKTELKNEKLVWKYSIIGEDVVEIPKINFNIESNYNSVVGNKLSTVDLNLEIISCWQKNAFILDEFGAEIKSKSFFALSTSAEDEEYNPKPKKMFFDKPFLTLLKRTDAKNPYFGLWTTNTELMLKE